MAEESRRKLPRWDYLVLPLLSLFTMVAFFAVAEITARSIWEAKEDSSCDLKTPFSGDRYKPNCTASMKLAEGPWVQNSYNECGYRSAASCGIKTPGTIRIALLGSSAAEGFMVPYRQTFASLTEEILTRECARTVEIQNLAITGIHLLEEAHRVDEALALRPDLVIFLVTPNDLTMDTAPQWDVQNSRRKAPTSAEKHDLRGLLLKLKVLLRYSAAISALRYYYFKDDQTYLHLYLRTYGDAADFLRLPFSSLWQTRFDFFDSLLREMASRVHSAGVPFVLIPSPFRPQVALLSSGEVFPGTDPFAFDRKVAQIAAMDGVVDFEVIHDFSHLAQSGNLFYVADGHMRAPGQEILALSVTRQILQSQILKSAGCSVVKTSS